MVSFGSDSTGSPSIAFGPDTLTPTYSSVVVLPSLTNVATTESSPLMFSMNASASLMVSNVPTSLAGVVSDHSRLLTGTSFNAVERLELTFSVTIFADASQLSFPTEVIS